MVWLALWAAAHHQPLRTLAAELEKTGWPRVIRRNLPRKVRRRRPDASTLSRRWRQSQFFELLEQALLRLGQPDRTAIIDGFVLPVGPHSHDVEAQFGGPGSHFQKGYKSVRLTNRRGQAWAVRIVSANCNEAAVASELLKGLAARRLKFTRIIGDRAYDSEPLRAQAHADLGALLVAPRQARNAKGQSRKCRKGRFRRRSMRVLRSSWGRHWMKTRAVVERSNGWLRQPPHELNVLPSFIRTPKRVRRWVVCQEVLMSLRIRIRHQTAKRTA